MRFFSTAWRRVRALVSGDALERDMDREMRAHLESLSREYEASGMPPEEARLAALRRFGNTVHLKERGRDVRGAGVIGDVLRDVRYAARSLGQARGFSLAVVGSLGLGLAGTVVAFALINGTMLQPLPGVQDQDRLLEVGVLDRSIFGWRVRRTPWTEYPDVVRALAVGLPSLEGLASFTESRVAARLPEPRSLQAAFVSSNYFDVFGVSPEIGRTFAPDEDRIESASVAVISRALWIREFAGDPSVIGEPIGVGEQSFAIIGVAPSGFEGPRGNVELWLPIVFTDLLAMAADPSGSNGRMGFTPAARNDPNPGRRIRYVGRMRDGVGAARVETELRVAAAGIVASSNDIVQSADDIVRSADDIVQSADDIVRSDDDIVASGDGAAAEVRVAVSDLSRFEWDEAGAAVVIPVLVLIIAGVNVANLLLVRASRRGREVALRLALGASRARLVRQLVIESLILALVAALLAVGLAWPGLDLLVAYGFPGLLDGTVVAGVLATAFLTALVFGLAPAFQAARQDPARALGTAPAGSGGTRTQSRVRRALVAGQVALSLGLLAVTFQLTSVMESMFEPPVTNADRLLLASFDLDELHFSTAQSNAFYSALLDRARRLPGGEAAGLSGRDLLWTGGGIANFIFLDPGPDGREGPARRMPVVGGSAAGDLFRIFEIDVVEGRDFVETDWRDMPEVAIVTERLASEFFVGPAVGRSLEVTEGAGLEANVRIVGIVESPADLYGQPIAAIFFPSPFLPSAGETGAARTLYLRSAGPVGGLATAVRDLVAEIDPRVPILELTSLGQKVEAQQGDERALSRAGALLGIVALLLTSIGLYGVTAYSVAMRAREIAVRMALGARPDSVLAMVLRQAATLVLVGSALGAVAASVVGGLIQAEIYGVAGVPFATLGWAAGLLAVAMLVASVLPARRAARLDPMVVLREE